MTDYYISETHIGGAKLRINRDRFSDLVLCREALMSLIDIEETYAVLCRSFVDLEECLFTCALRYAYERSGLAELDGIFEYTRNTINVKLISFLTASRAYSEQVSSRMLHMNKLHGTSFNPSEQFSREFDKSPTYRVMDALRNHALHHRLPINSVSFSRSNLYAPEHGLTKSRLRLTFNPRIKIGELVDNAKLRKATREELAHIGAENIDVKYFVRGFISSLAQCHHEFRQWTQGIFESSHSKSTQAKEDLERGAGKEAKNISATKTRGGETAEEHYIDPEVFSSLLRSRSAWSHMRYAHRLYISTEVVKEKNTYPDDDDSLWITK